MSGFQITITDAGRAALIDAQNTGTVAFKLSQIGVSTAFIAGGVAALTVLPNERKRLATMAGDVVADDTLHVTIRDQGDDAYSLRTFGIYTSTGILFAVYTQADPILEKSPAAMLLLAVDARLVALGTALVEFGPVGFTLPPASETVIGVVELATDAEVDAGVDPWRVITVRTLKRALGALANYALTGHKHDAGDTTTGVFNVGRIPALDMAKITGLAIALSNKAEKVHNHVMAEITGLIDALAGKAEKDHNHDAGDTTTGVFNVGRIPALDMAKITGLAVALAERVSSALSIVAGNGLTGGGTLAASRTITLGTPSTITGSSTNSVSTQGHSHELSIGTADVAGLDTALAARALTTVQVIAGNGLTGGGTLAANRTLTLGTPTTISGSSTNVVTSGGHAHALSIGTADVTGLPTALEAAAPVGSVAFFARSTAPGNWVVCNGLALSRTTYAALFSVIGTTFGAGNGTTTFNVPDLRGEFVRGFDAGRGVDSGRVFGSAQADELRAHDHFAYAGTGQGSINVPAVDNDGNTPNRTNPTSMTGGVETRPRNVALLPCIKF